jgi:hypothetical protein
LSIHEGNLPSDSKLVQEWFLYSQNDLVSAHHLFNEILDACADLTPYGVAVRYPNELAVDDPIAKSAIGKAQSIYDFCIGKVPVSSSNGEENCGVV